MLTNYDQTCEALRSLDIDPEVVLRDSLDATGFTMLGRHQDGQILPSAPDGPELSRVPWATHDAWARVQVALEEDISLTTPRRVQLSRQKGWRKPTNTVIVARPSKWGNPWRVGETTDVVISGRSTATTATFGKVVRLDVSPDLAVALFRALIGKENIRIRAELAGKNLACWCPLDQPCHADVLLELANSGAS